MDGVGVTVGLPVAGTVSEGVAVPGVGVRVGVGVLVGVWVGVAVGDGVGLAVGVGVTVPTPIIR